jgi:hypothetical protein
MGILLSYPLIHTCSLLVIYSFLLDGIRWLIIRRPLTWARLWVTDGRILLIGRQVVLRGIGWSYLRFWLLENAALYRNLMFWLGEVLLLESIMFLLGTLH